MEITDHITVLRDGAVAGELVTAEASHDQVVKMIVGRNLDSTSDEAGVRRETSPSLASRTWQDACWSRPA